MWVSPQDFWSWTLKGVTALLFQWFYEVCFFFFKIEGRKIVTSMTSSFFNQYSSESFGHLEENRMLLMSLQSQMSHLTLKVGVVVSLPSGMTARNFFSELLSFNRLLPREDILQEATLTSHAKGVTVFTQSYITAFLLPFL
jgi:hypothetical protein